MELGICVRDVPAAEAARLGRFAEDHGFTHLFVPDVRGGAAPTARDAFVALAAAFEATATLRAGVGVAAVIFHDPPSLARLAGTLNEQSDGRFVLGLGVSHREATAGSTASYPAFGAGFPILVGALGPKMTSLGAAEADGVLLNWLTPQHAAETVRQVRAAAPPGRTAKTVLYVRISPAAAVRQDAVNYDQLANYHRHFEMQGLASPEDIVAGTCLPADDPAAVRDRLAAYDESGIDVLCLYPHGFDEAERCRVLEAVVA